MKSSSLEFFVFLLRAERSITRLIELQKAEQLRGELSYDGKKEANEKKNLA